MVQYTLEEVSEHNNEKSLWLVVDGKVYDVTSFLEKHPGGRNAFLKYAGKDVTKTFKSISKHMASDTLPKFMESLCIGTVQPPQPSPEAEAEPLKIGKPVAQIKVGKGIEPIHIQAEEN